MTTIPAETHSDDYAEEVSFDALAWFEQARDKDICDLAACGWGGDYPADHVAEFFRSGATRRVFDYLYARHSDSLCGFECHVDGDAALTWLLEHRPHLVGVIAT